MYFVTAIGAPFQKYNDIFGYRHKDTEKKTLQVARSTRRRVSAGEASLCLSVSVACPNQYVSVLTKCRTQLIMTFRGACEFCSRNDFLLSSSCSVGCTLPVTSVTRETIVWAPGVAPFHV